MVKSADCLKKYGDPWTNQDHYMVMWDVPSELEHGAIPKKMYCNRDMIGPLSLAFKYINERGLASQVRTYDGCFNIRKKRGSSTPSLHSWGIAIDINAAWNGFGKTPTMSAELVQCFKDAGFDWGGDWKTVKDGMHFQLSKLP